MERFFFPWSGPWGPDFSDNCVYIQRQGQSAPSGQIKEEEMGSAACSPHPKGVSAMEQLGAKGHFFFQKMEGLRYFCYFVIGAEFGV